MTHGVLVVVRSRINYDSPMTMPPTDTASTHNPLPDPARASSSAPMPSISGGLRALIACLVALLVVFGAIQVASSRGRHVVDGHHRYEVAGPREGFDLLSGLSVRGRVVVVYDKTSHIQKRFASEFLPAETTVTAIADSSDFVEAFIVSGIARSVYIVVPDAEWPRIESGLLARGDSIVTSDSARARVYGAPVTYVRADSLPTFAEPVVAYLNADVASEYSPGLLGVLDQPNYSDVVVVQGGVGQ